MKNCLIVKDNGDITIFSDDIENGYDELANVAGNNYDGYESLDRWIEERNNNLDDPYADPLEEGVYDTFRDLYVKEKIDKIKDLL